MEKNWFKKASDFQPLEGEANFPPPIQTEVVGGMHIAPEIVTRRGDEFLMIEWPEGLPRHDTGRTVRFPHGLMQFGESVNECASRLVNDQLGVVVERTQVIDLDSYVDDADHWHIEPLILADISGDPAPHTQAGRVITIHSVDQLPDDALWVHNDFVDLVNAYLE